MATEQRERDDGSILEATNVRKEFGGLVAVNDVDFVIPERSIVSLIGPNGAGKTTMFNLVTGIYAPDAGEVLFDGENIAGLPPHAITQRGIARTFQTLRLFLNMSVKENVMAAAYGHTKATVVESMLRLPRARREEREIARLAEEKLAFFGPRLIGYRMDQPAYSLSYANRRRLEIARAMATNPRLLLLDEPAAGMNLAEMDTLVALIRSLAREGQTILLIEHNMQVVMGVCDRIVVLNFGRKIAEGPPARVSRDRDVIAAYLGSDE